MGEKRGTRYTANQYWIDIYLNNNLPVDAPVLEANVIGLPNISWNLVDGATSYNLYRGTSPDGETLYLSDLEVVGVVDHDVSYGTHYYYKMKSVRGSVESAFSNEVDAIPISTSVLSGMAGDNTVSLSWTAGTGAATYGIGRSTTPGTEGLLVTGLGPTHYDDNLAVNNTTYYYTIIGQNSTGVSLVSNEISKTPVAP